MSSLTTCWTSKLSTSIEGCPSHRLFRFIRHKAPKADSYSPASPDQMDWSKHYPTYFPPSAGEPSTAPMNALAGQKQAAEWADVGCGFGGLLMDLAPKFPDTLMLGGSLSLENALLMVPSAVYVDVGCRHQRLILALRATRPATNINVRATRTSADRAGMEIRPSVTSYVSSRILASRQIQAALPADSPEAKAGGYQNVSVIRANSMKHMPNFFAKGQLSKIFFLFPDPHFKLRKQKARIVT